MLSLHVIPTERVSATRDLDWSTSEDPSLALGMTAVVLIFCGIYFRATKNAASGDDRVFVL